SNLPSSGSSRVFYPDPIVDSGNATLSPTSRKLDDYALPMILDHLDGRGVLAGTYVDVRNGVGCGGRFGAYDAKNNFVYPHSDSRFQEAMAYYWGDQYRASLATAGYNVPAELVKIIAHCVSEDNAFFYSGKND